MNGIEIAYLSDAKATTGVTAPEQINVEAGKTASVNATVAPADSTERVSYISENPEIATVHPRTGEITGVAAGTAKIKTISGDFTAETSVTVSKSYAASLDKSQSNIVITSSESGTDTLKWSSDNTKVARVDQNGKITAVAAGTANIKVTTVSPIAGKEKSAVCKVTVKAKEIKPVPKPPVKKPSMTISGKTTVKKGKASISVKCGTLKKTVKITVK